MSFLEKKNARRAGGNSNWSGDERVPFRVKGYVLKDPSSVAYEAEDTLEAFLLRDALGIKAEFDAQGEPLTVVKIRLNDKQAGDRPTVASFKNGVEPLAAPMLAGNGAIGIADGCKLEGDIIVANWLNRAFVEYNHEQHYLMDGKMACVRREGHQRTGEKRAYQTRLVAFTELSAAVSSLAEAKKAMIDTLQMILDDQAPGDPGFLLRGSSPSGLYAASVEMFRGWQKGAEGEEGRYQTPAETVEAFFNDESRGKDWAPELDDKNQDTIWEVIPMLRLSTGRASLPEYKKQQAEKKKVTIDDRWYQFNDESRRYRRVIDVPTDEPGVTVEQFEQCFTLSDVLVQRDERKDPETNKPIPGDYKSWYAKETRPTVGLPKMFVASELVTDHLTDELKATFIDRADKRARRPKKEAGAAPEQENENDNANDDPAPEQPRTYAI